jgi:CBS domain-containing protein
VVPTNKPMLSLTAADLMSPATVVVPEDMSLQGAARLLSHARVSGAPVVNADGRCVGVISTTDFLHWAERGKGSAAVPAQGCVCSAWQIVDAGRLPAEAVRDYMTADPVTAAASAGVGELARTMLDAHIHRVIVVDRERRPTGVVSSTDILAAVAQADAVSRAAVPETCPR